MSHDYFYGAESDSFSFYRIPRLFVTGEEYKRVSAEAKLLYGLLLDRMGLSARNGWYDELDRVYIYYRTRFKRTWAAGMKRPSSCLQSWTATRASVSLSV